MDDPDLHPEPLDDEPDAFELRPPAGVRRWLLRQDAQSRDLEPIRSLLSPLYDPWYRSCIECGGELGRNGDLYYLERALRRGEPIFEYALCENCVYSFQDDLSKQSLQKIYRYWLQNFDVERRQQVLEGSSDARGLVANCVFTDRPREELDEFQVWAWIRDGQLWVDPYSPAVISSEIIEQMSEQLSRQTRDRIDDFIRDRLGLPPELQNLPLLL